MQTSHGTCFEDHTTGWCAVGVNCKFQHKCYLCLEASPPSNAHFLCHWSPKSWHTFCQHHSEIPFLTVPQPQRPAHDNNNSYIALYPVNIYELSALYIMNINIHLTIKKALVSQMHTSIPTWWKVRMKHDNQKSTSTVNACINTKAFYTQSKKHKYYKCIHQYQHVSQKSTSTVNAYLNTKALHTLPPNIWLHTDTYTLTPTPTYMGTPTPLHTPTHTPWDTTHAHRHTHHVYTNRPHLHTHTHRADKKSDSSSRLSC